MAQPNGLNPTFDGRVVARGFEAIHGKGVCVTVATCNGTSNTNVFGALNGFNGTITGVFLITQGATSQTVTVKGPATVASITTGATTGLFAASTSVLSNTAISATGTLVIVSGSTSDTSKVFITYQVVES